MRRELIYVLSTHALVLPAEAPQINEMTSCALVSHFFERLPNGKIGSRYEIDWTGKVWDEILKRNIPPDEWVVFMSSYKVNKN